MASENHPLSNISIEHFAAVEMRVETILTAVPFEKALKPAIQLTIDFGPLGIKKSSAQITDHYHPDELVGTQIVAVLNLPPRQIANFMSDCLVLGSVDAKNKVTLLRPDFAAVNGDRIA